MRRRMMGGKAVEGGIGDSNTVLLLHGDAISGRFVDSSPADRYIGNLGGVSQNAIGKFGKSILFDGSTNSYLTLNSSAGFVFGVGDFTLDFWIFPRNVNTPQGIFATGQTWNTGNGIMCYVQYGGLAFYVSSSTLTLVTTPIPINKWTHVAISRANTMVRTFINGVLQDTTQIYTNIQSLGVPRIGKGQDDTSSEVFSGLLDELRVSNIARWSSNFEVPTKPYGV